MTMPNRFVSVLLAFVLGSAPAALAQPAPAAKEGPATTVAPVTVHAAPTPRAVVEQSRSFVRSYAAASNPEIDQIGRWHDGVCVQVEGLAAEQAGVIKARIESVAEAVGLPAARAGCTANIEIVFTGEPQTVMDSVAKRRESLLGWHDQIDLNRVKTVTHPIQAWYQTATRGEGANSGMAFANFSNRYSARIPPEQVAQIGLPGQSFDRETTDTPGSENPTGCADSHFSACLKSLFKNVFVVADSKAVEGRSLGVVADYMVMLALSQPRSLDGCNALPSVIDRFAKSPCPGRDPPDGLTRADAAYLTALYAADLEARRAGEQDDIAGRMAKILSVANVASR